MKSPVFILFLIISMLTINVASAGHAFNDSAAESHLNVVQHDEPSSTDSDHEDSNCNHFCHISSHLVGLVSQTITPSIIRTPVAFLAFQKSFHSLIHTPPSHPPKA